MNLTDQHPFGIEEELKFHKTSNILLKIYYNFVIIVHHSILLEVVDDGLTKKILASDTKCNNSPAENPDIFGEIVVAIDAD